MKRVFATSYSCENTAANNVSVAAVATAFHHSARKVVRRHTRTEDSGNIKWVETHHTARNWKTSLPGAAAAQYIMLSDDERLQRGCGQVPSRTLCRRARGQRRMAGHIEQPSLDALLPGDMG